MTSTPQRFDYSIPPSPLFPPVPRVSPASSTSSLNSLYELDGQRLQTSLYDSYDDSSRERQLYYTMSKEIRFTDEELARAFQDRIHDQSYVSAGSSPSGRLAHDVSDPQSPWKRSIRLKYSDVNMRDTNSNTLALQEASELLSRDMASYVFSLYAVLMIG
jgi:hypothetical protein